MKKKIVVIGAGVSGITTALTLQLFGYDTICYTKQRVDDAIDDPQFASLYPAASIIPHSVQSDSLDEFFPASQAIFKFLNEQNGAPVYIYRHFEIFESPEKLPTYTKYLHNFSLIDDLKSSKIPQRKNAPALSGWSFDCFIAEWPKYMHRLHNLYVQAGGAIQRREVNHPEIKLLPAQIIINCSGSGSLKLFKNSEKNPKISRGHLIHVVNQQSPPKNENYPISYNYTPKTKIYATPGGHPADVYFYPVNDKWILGGSRQIGSLNEDNTWVGETHADTISIEGLDVPRQVLELNAEVLEHTFGISIEESSEMNSFVGYRYTPECGLRLALVETGSKKIIHNYGHGGAGVSLSWGCALKVVNLVRKMETNSRINPLRNSKFISDLQRQLQKVYLERDI